MEGETEREKGKGEGVWRQEKQRRDEEGRREEWRTEQGEEGMRAKEEGMDGLRCCTPPTRRPQEQISKQKTHRHRIPPLLKPRHLPRLPYASLLCQGREHAWGRERRKKGLKGFRTAYRGVVRVQEREEEVCREGEEWGEEEHVQCRGGVDGPAEQDDHILNFGHRGLGPTDEGGFMAGGGGEGDCGWKDGRIGVAVCCREGTAQPGGVSRILFLGETGLWISL
ncbi:hypothetical protein B0H13DRAFT_1915490 [Mycena leptocephala]|nr:hypothetical protein B0H13DRAFT_1915490 [Mycena leptocephala]